MPHQNPRTSPTPDLECITKKLIDEVSSQNLGIVLDPFNLLTPENADNYYKICDEAFDKFGDKIEAVQIKDYQYSLNFAVEQRPLFKGKLNILEAIAYFNKQKPGIDIISEDTSGADLEYDMQQIKKYHI